MRRGVKHGESSTDSDMNAISKVQCQCTTSRIFVISFEMKRQDDAMEGCREGDGGELGDMYAGFDVVYIGIFRGIALCAYSD